MDEEEAIATPEGLEKAQTLEDATQRAFYMRDELSLDPQGRSGVPCPANVVEANDVVDLECAALEDEQSWDEQKR